LIVQHVRKHRIGKLIASLARERGQAMPEYTVTLAVISGTSVLPFTGFSANAARAITSVVRLFF
jgi:hypothetical protein